MDDEVMNDAPAWAQRLLARLDALEEHVAGLRRTVDRVDDHTAVPGLRFLPSRTAAIEATLGAGIVARGHQNARLEDVAWRVAALERHLGLPHRGPTDG